MLRITSTAISAALLQILSTQPAMADADIDRYIDSGYSYCDAVILGQFWGESVDEAKSTIGRKIGWGNADIVADNIDAARERGERCEFYDTGFTFEDAEAWVRACASFALLRRTSAALAVGLKRCRVASTNPISAVCRGRKHSRACAHLNRANTAIST